MRLLGEKHVLKSDFFEGPSEMKNVSTIKPRGLVKRAVRRCLTTLKEVWTAE